MRRSLSRLVGLGALATALMVLGGGAAAATHVKPPLPRPGFQGFQGGAGPRGGPGGFGFGFGGPGLGPDVAGPGLRIGGGFGLGPGAGAGTLDADVLTSAAAFLNESVSSLTSDLAGGKTLAQEAVAKGKTAADLITAIVKAQTAVYDNEKAAGWITATQETALTTGFTNTVTDLVNTGPAVPPGGQGGQVAGTGGPLQLAAAYLEVSVSDLQQDLKGGKDLADVVGSVNGRTVAGLVTALEAPAKTKLDAAVTAGTITQAQETAILARMTTALTDFANTKPGTSPSSSTTNAVRRA
jgi:hypothetical protein